MKLHIIKKEVFMSITDKDMRMREGDKRRMHMALKDESEATKKLYRRKDNIKPVSN